jgi:hypothetical protein
MNGTTSSENPVPEKNLGDQPAEKRKTGNPEKHAQHAKRHGPQNAKPDAPGKAPES